MTMTTMLKEASRSQPASLLFICFALLLFEKEKTLKNKNSEFIDPKN